MTLGLAGCGKSTTLEELSATDQALAGPAFTETPVPPNSSTQIAFQMMASQTAQAQDILASQAAQAQAIQSTQTAQAEGILLAETSQAQALQSTQTAQAEGILLAETSQAQALQSTQAAQGESILLAETSQAQAIQSTQAAQVEGTLLAETSQAQAIQSTQTAQEEGTLRAATSQAQAIVNAQVLQTNQAAAALTSFPMTATPYAATQAAGVVQEYDREQQAFINQIVIPLLPILGTLVLVLFILLILVVYRRYMVTPWSRRTRFGRGAVNPAQLMMEDGVIIDPGSRPEPTKASEQTPVPPNEPMVEGEVQVDIVDPADPIILQWIAEAEDKLKDDGKEPL